MHVTDNWNIFKQKISWNPYHKNDWNNLDAQICRDFRMIGSWSGEAEVNAAHKTRCELEPWKLEYWCRNSYGHNLKMDDRRDNDELEIKVAWRSWAAVEGVGSEVSCCEWDMPAGLKPQPH